MGTNIGGISNLTGIKVGKSGIYNTDSIISSSVYVTTAISSESIYTYQSDLARVYTQYSSSRQTQSLFWVNTGTHGDGLIHWSDIITSNHVYVDGGQHQYFIISKKDNEATLLDDNIYGDAYAKVYDIHNYVKSGDSYYQYNKLNWDGGPFPVIEIYNVDVTNITYSSSVLFTIPDTGSYTFLIRTLSYGTLTSSITLESTAITVPGVTDLNTGSLHGTYFNGHILFTDVTSSWNLHEEGDLLKAPIIDAPIYLKTDGTYGMFEVPSDKIEIFKPGTVIEIAGYSLLVNGSITGTESLWTTSGSFLHTPIGTVPSLPTTTRVYTMTYPLISSIYYPLNVIVGNSSYSLGYNTVATYGNQFIVGTYNETGSHNKLLAVGNGSSESDRKDALAVNVDGVTILGSGSAPTPVPGGIYYDGTHFYLGF